MVFYGSFADGDNLPSGIELGGDAYLDRDFGIQLDGDEDYFSINERQWYSYSDLCHLFLVHQDVGMQ